MGKTTGIAWTDHTFNGWWGCTKVAGAPECAFCYAETFSHRLGLDLWGKDADRRTFGEKHWKAPEAWNRQAQREGRRHRVFAMSMADWAEDRSDLDEPRDRLFDLIRRTPWLDWQLLTKRIENVPMMLPKDWGPGYRNVWLGVTAGTQKRADEQIPALLRIPAQVRFVSAEPLLEELDLREYLPCPECEGRGWYLERFADNHATACESCIRGARAVGVSINLGQAAVSGPRLDWVIPGGENGRGPNIRECQLRWIRRLVADCQAAGVACFVKQLGSKPLLSLGWPDDTFVRVGLRDPAGADPTEWPADLHVQQFPAIAKASA